jgi:hypothetical protein
MVYRALYAPLSCASVVGLDESSPYGLWHGGAVVDLLAQFGFWVGWIRAAIHQTCAQALALISRHAADSARIRLTGQSLCAMIFAI